MGHYYQDLDAPHFDYDLQVVDGLGDKKFRGPAIDPSKPYVVCIGAAQTYGRFVSDPYSQILARQLGMQVLNLGVGGAGPEHFLSAGYLKWLNNAELVIVQMLSGRSAGNSLFDNSRTGGLLGVRLTDYKEMRFEGFLEEVFATEPVQFAKRIVEETRASFVVSFVRLLESINAPRLLLWFSDRSADYADDFSSVWAVLNRYPQLINRPMLETIRLHCDAVVECVSGEGLPQTLWPGAENIDGAVSRNGTLFNEYYPSPEMHAHAAELLLPICQRFVPSSTKAKSRRSAGQTPGSCRFVVLGAERTGTNLLVGLLDSHPDCFVCGEVFNSFYVESGQIPWITEDHAEDAELNALRAADPVAFAQRLFEIGSARGLPARGFKLMYGQADSYPSMRDFLISDPDIRIVHLKRRNLLRRFTSERQAIAAGVWAQGKEASDPMPPAVTLSPVDCVWDFTDKESNSSRYDELLLEKGRLLEVFYENLADDPQAVGARVIRFLGLRPAEDLEIRYRKTGAESLRDVVTNYDELKAHILRWASFFDG